MKNILVGSLLLCLASYSLAQTLVSGRVMDNETKSVIVGAKVTLVNQSLSVMTDENGQFSLSATVSGDEEITVEADGYLFDIRLINIKQDVTTDIGEITLKPNISEMASNEYILNIGDEDLNDDEGRSQAPSSPASDSRDVFNATTSYAWSTARWRKRGYEQPYEYNYINGLNFNTAERGSFNFSSFGGLNDVSRIKEQNNPIGATNYSFGGIGNATNYLVDASLMPNGWKIGLAGTNRNYKAAIRATYASGILKNGWAFASQIAFRFSPYIDHKGIIGEGVNYYSLGYFFSASKRWKNGNKFNIITFGAPTQRGQSAAVTQEVYDLTGSIYYNPYWGYQDGRIRNYRIVKSFDPVIVANLDLNFNNNNKLYIALGYHYSMYSNSALIAFNSPDPRPDYYRNLPSFLWDGQIVSASSAQLYDAFTGQHHPYGIFIGSNLNSYPMGNGSVGNDGYNLGPTINADIYNALVDAWKKRDNNVTQLNWDNLYAANYAHPDTARYVLERRHNDIQEIAATARYTNTHFNHLKMTAVVELKSSQGIHYKTVDDLLGASKWIDIDNFADRDIKDLASNIGLSATNVELVRQNDIRYYIKNGQSPIVNKNNTFGYDYRLNINKASMWFQNEWNFNHIDVYYALSLSYTHMQRITKMINGRAWYQAMARGQVDDFESAFRYFGIDKNDKNAYDDLINVLSGEKIPDGMAHHFFDPAFKLGLTYKINGRNKWIFNATAQTEAPLARNAYISPRVHDVVIDNIYKHDTADNLKDFFASNRKIVSGDLSYEFNYPILLGRITGYYTHMWNGTELNGYYDDEIRTFVNQAITGINQRHCGIEAALSIKMGTYLTLTGVTSVGDHRYVSNAYCVTSAENGMALAQDINNQNIYETRDSILIKGLRVATGPQINASLKLSFFHPKMWFADITLSYHDKNYLAYAPPKRMKGLFYGQRTDGTIVNGWYGDTYANAIQTTDGKNVNIDDFSNIQTDKNGTPILNYPYNLISDQENISATNVWNRFLIDVSIGKLIYFKNRQSLSINLSVTNIANNTHFKTGGYQQSRIPRMTRQGVADNMNSVISPNAWKYPAKYYYAWGTNFYLTLTYKF